MKGFPVCISSYQPNGLHSPSIHPQDGELDYLNWKTLIQLKSEGAHHTPEGLQKMKDIKARGGKAKALPTEPVRGAPSNEVRPPAQLLWIKVESN